VVDWTNLIESLRIGAQEMLATEITFEPDSEWNREGAKGAKEEV
jgi:hypothetical protein